MKIINTSIDDVKVINQKFLEMIEVIFSNHLIKKFLMKKFAEEISFRTMNLIQKKGL